MDIAENRRIMNKYETTTDLSDFGKMNNLSMDKGDYGMNMASNTALVTDTPPSGSRENLAAPDPERPTPRITIPDPQERHKGLGLENMTAVFGEERKHSNTPRLPHNGSLLGIFYGIILVVLGVSFPTKEALERRWLSSYITAVYLVYLYGCSFIFLVALEIYLVCLHKQSKSKRIDADQTTVPPANITVTRADKVTTGFVNLAYEPQSPTSRTRRLVSFRDNRLSSEGAFSESTVCDDAFANGILENKRETTLYIRIVFIVLGLAALVYDGLLVKQLQEQMSPSSCGDFTIFWHRYVHMAFLLVQCYFFFKHSQLSAITNKAIFRLGFVHVLATNLSELARNFINQSLNTYVYEQELSDTQDNSTTIPCDFSEDIMYRAGPYLYPCVIQYNFLAAALVYFMSTSLGEGFVLSPPNFTDLPKKTFTEINCQRTHKGLFFGIIILAGTAVGIILFFSYMQNSPETNTSLLIYQIVDIALHGVLVFAIVAAWAQTSKLSFLYYIELSFEDCVLLISMSLGVLFSVFEFLPTIQLVIDGERDLYIILSLTGSLLAMSTSVFQSSFMIDMSCRYLTLDAEWESKPGRGSIMFLLLTNLSLWLLKSFQIKVLDMQAGWQEDNYGFLSWQLMIHGFVPFLIYYYLFSSACLARTWHQTYINHNRGDGEVTSRHERFSTPAKEFEFVRHRKNTARDRIDVDEIISPVSDV